MFENALCGRIWVRICVRNGPFPVAFWGVIGVRNRPFPEPFRARLPLKHARNGFRFVSVSIDWIPGPAGTLRTRPLHNIFSIEGAVVVSTPNRHAAHRPSSIGLVYFGRLTLFWETCPLLWADGFRKTFEGSGACPSSVGPRGPWGVRALPVARNRDPCSARLPEGRKWQPDLRRGGLCMRGIAP